MCQRQSGRKFVFRGKVVSGRGEGQYFTQLRWVAEQFSIKLGFEPVAGTFNLRLAGEADEMLLDSLKNLPGVTITPPEAGFCDAKCFPARIKSVAGALVIPLVENYPRNLLEIIAPVNLRHALGVKDGEVVEICVNPAS
jgi:riboflavin kinase